MLSLQAAIMAIALGGTGEPTLLEFTADWCGPCRQMQPVIGQLKAAGYPVREVNVDRERDLVTKYGVDGIPCCVLVVDGQEVDRVVGAASVEQLVQLFGKARGQAPPAPPAGMAIPRVTSEAPLGKAIDASSDARAAAEIVPRLLAASVRIRIEDSDGHSVGSGTIIDARSGEALVLTCGHIFRDSQGKGKIAVDMFGPGAAQNLAARLVSYDLEADLGLLSFRPTGPLQPVAVAPSNRPTRSGETVISVGCDHGRDATAQISRVTSTNKFLGAANVQVAGQPVQGRSGGGLFTADGLLVGVCNAADPSDNEGLFAGLPAIHGELGRSGVARVLAGSANPAAPPADAVSSAVTSMPERMPPVALGTAAPAAVDTVAGLSPQEQAVVGQLRRQSGAAEVICIVRPLADPHAKSEIIVLDKASPAFLKQLAAAREQQNGRFLTSLEMPSESAGGNALPSAANQQSSGDWQPHWKLPSQP